MDHELHPGYPHCECVKEMRKLLAEAHDICWKIELGWGSNSRMIEDAAYKLQPKLRAMLEVTLVIPDATRTD